MVENLSPRHVLVDKVYDVDRLIETIQNTEAKVCIPPKRNRITQRDYDKDFYKERNQVECMFGKLKEFRRVATRYDKLITSFMGLSDVRHGARLGVAENECEPAEVATSGLGTRS